MEDDEGWDKKDEGRVGLISSLRIDKLRPEGQLINGELQD